MTNDQTSPRVNLAPDGIDRAISLAALLLLAATAVALARGRGEWAQIPGLVWGHLSGAVLAMALTPVMLLRRRGDQLHRRLGYLWVTAMALTAGLSLGVRVLRPGLFSPIHLLSLYTLANLPLLVRAARRHDITAHRRAIRRMAIGALLIAGTLTFTFHRMLAEWLYGG